MDWLRYTLAALPALAVTFALFFFMQYLILMADAMLKERVNYGAIEFVRLERESQTQKKERVLPTKPSKVEQPSIPRMTSPTVQAPTGYAVAMDTPDLKADVDLKGQKLELGAAPSDSEEVPVVRVEPMFPQDAAERGIEGWVVVRFDLDPTGSVINARVVDADPKRIFDRAVLNAVAKWKYRPRIQGGKTLNSKGLEVRLTFKLGQ